MREIEFRGWNEKNSKWIYGYYFVNRGEPFIVDDGIVTNPFMNADDFMVSVNTVGQYTGMKDSKGNKIYEGDIVQLTISNGTIRIFVVEWAEEDRKLIPLDGFEHDGNPVRICGWCFNWNGFRLYPTVIDGIPDNEKMTIVGNIYDNPELLNDGSKE